MVKPPTPNLSGEQRFNACKEALELEFLELVDAATAAGWEAREVAIALIAVSDDFMLTWIGNSD